MPTSVYRLYLLTDDRAASWLYRLRCLSFCFFSIIIIIRFISYCYNLLLLLPERYFVDEEIDSFRDLLGHRVVAISRRHIKRFRAYDRLRIHTPVSHNRIVAPLRINHAKRFTSSYRPRKTVVPYRTKITIIFY